MIKQIKFKKVETFVRGNDVSGNTMERSLEFGSWKVERPGSYKYSKIMGEDIFISWSGDWILTRNGEFYGSFEKLKEVKFYIRYWLSIHPNDL